MVSNAIAKITAAILLITSVSAIVFGPTIGAVEPSAEGYAFLGITAGIGASFLFISRKDE